MNSFLDRPPPATPSRFADGVPWQAPPIEGEWTCLWLDATYLKVCEDGRVVSIAAIIATGVNTDGRREILGLGLGPSEAAVFWLSFLRSLEKRGLKAVKLVISDAYEGLKAAVAQVFKATWQGCRVHFMRNALAYAPRAQHQMAAAAIRTVFTQDTQAAASKTWRQVADQLRPRIPRLADLMDGAEADVIAFMTKLARGEVRQGPHRAKRGGVTNGGQGKRSLLGWTADVFPKIHWPKLHSTNPIERLNKKVNRRADVVGIFPNEALIRRLIGAVLLEQNNECQLQHRYVTLETMNTRGDDQSVAITPHRSLNARSGGASVHPTKVHHLDGRDPEFSNQNSAMTQTFPVA